MEEFIKLIIVAAPGFWANEIYRSHVTRKKKSEFESLALSVINGLVILLFYITADSKLFNGKLNSNTLFTSGMKWFASNNDFLCVMGSLFVFGTLWGIILIIVLKITRRFPKIFKPNYYTVWQNVIENPTSEWAVVFMKDSSIYIGSIVNARIDPNTEDQDFLLSKARKVNEKLKVIYVINGSGVYINTRDVNKIEFLKAN